MKQAIAAGIVRWTGVGALFRNLFARRNVTIVVYHDPDPEVMRAHLAWYAERYSFTTLDAVADALESGRWGDLPPYPLVVTFDDGHRNNARLEPLFKEFGVRPTIYLCSRVVGTARPYWWKTAAAGRIGAETLKRLPDPERRRRLAEAGDDPDRDGADRQSLTWDEVRRLATVTDYGAHTRTHPILLQCDDQRCAEEIALCKTELEEATGLPCRHFAFPNGDFSDREVAIIRQAGYRTARTIDPGWNGPKADPLRLHAVPISDDASVDWLSVQVTGIPAWLRKRKNGGVTQAPTPTHGDPLPAA
ncbi:polysaccharide deacetylase family protein [Azospirillum brasilense]|uniref:polysaccharide deacetylase family protein n=1 Tax=Azospirillum brasilense TaxID=192 RepID=UPI00190D4305|nr:polysaccharide deacetylase family protein [Azospirillum brasilense]MBK3735057.1 polysaccharide deacetylase family protein [Azospirillum brasilense]